MKTAREATGSALLAAFFGYNQAMNARLWGIIRQHLSDEQFTAESGYSRGSIRSQMVHMADAQHYWLRGLLGRQELPALQAHDYPTREAARQACQQADQTILEAVQRLTEADLARIPEVWSEPVWVGLLQVAQHGTDHRAQVLRALHDLGAPTFEQNFAVYMENLTPLTVPQVLELIQTKRAVWDGLLDRVPAGQMDQPLLEGWTVREAVAILTWKEQRLTEILHSGVVSGVSFGELPPAEQQRVLAASRAGTWETLLAEHRAAHRAMLAEVQKLSDEALNAEDLPGLPPGDRFWKVIEGATWWSYAGFARALKELLGEQAPQAED